jgi:hypothetical protein
VQYGIRSLIAVWSYFIAYPYSLSRKFCFVWICFNTSEGEGKDLCLQEARFVGEMKAMILSPFKPKLIKIIFKNSGRTSKKT